MTAGPLIDAQLGNSQDRGSYLPRNQLSQAICACAKCILGVEQVFLPVVRQAKVAKGSSWLHPLVRKVVDGHDAARVLVHAVPAVLGRDVGRHQTSMPVVGNKQHPVAVREAGWLIRPAGTPSAKR